MAHDNDDDLGRANAQRVLDARTRAAAAKNNERHEMLIRLATEAYDSTHRRPSAEELATWSIFAQSAARSAERDRTKFLEHVRERTAQAAQCWAIEAELGEDDTARSLEAALRKRGVWNLSMSIGAQFISLRAHVGEVSYTARGEDLVRAVGALLAHLDEVLP